MKLPLPRNKYLRYALIGAVVYVAYKFFAKKSARDDAALASAGGGKVVTLSSPGGASIQPVTLSPDIVPRMLPGDPGNFIVGFGGGRTIDGIEVV